MFCFCVVGGAKQSKAKQSKIVVPVFSPFSHLTLMLFLRITTPYFNMLLILLAYRQL